VEIRGSNPLGGTTHNRARKATIGLTLERCAASAGYAAAVTWYRWLGINAGLFLATIIVFSYAAYAVDAALGAQHGPLEIAFAPLGLLMFLGPLYAVGFALYLPAVTLIPMHWSSRARRLAAMLLSPIVGAPIWFITPPNPSAVAPYAVLLPLFFGAVVRLVEPSGRHMDSSRSHVP
jgi:hypothetical protein